MNRFRHVMTLDNTIASIFGLSSCFVLYEAYTRTSLNDAQTAIECRYPPTSKIIREEHIRTLERNDLVVIRNVLSFEELSGARKTAISLGETRMDVRNHENDDDVRQDKICLVKEQEQHHYTQGRGKGKGKREEIHNQDEEEYGDDLIHCIKLLRGIPYLLDRFNYSVSESYIVPRQCQLAKYLPDGSVYTRHLDKCTSTLTEMGLLGWLRSSDYRNRAVTAILYLNNEAWESGGELRCFDFDDDENVTDINPVGGTLVLFDSGKVQHEVLPSTEERYALTIWINGVLINQK